MTRQCGRILLTQVAALQQQLIFAIPWVWAEYRPCNDLPASRYSSFALSWVKTLKIILLLFLSYLCSATSRALTLYGAFAEWFQSSAIYEGWALFVVIISALYMIQAGAKCCAVSVANMGGLKSC
jgi:hypothetical protein